MGNGRRIDGQGQKFRQLQKDSGIKPGTFWPSVIVAGCVVAATTIAIAYLIIS